MVFVVILLLIIVAIFGIASGMQSYATAQQAQAQIEVAKAAQISAVGNVIIIFSFLVIAIVILALIAAVLYVRTRRPKAHQTSGNARKIGGGEPPAMDPNQALGLMVQMRLLEMLDSMNSQRQLGASREEQDASTEEPFPWLRR